MSKNNRHNKKISFDDAVEIIILLRTLNPKRFTYRKLGEIVGRHYTTVEQIYKEHYHKYAKLVESVDK